MSYYVKYYAKRLGEGRGTLKYVPLFKIHLFQYDEIAEYGSKHRGKDQNQLSDLN